MNERAILGVILAGGQSSRMGREKAFVLLDGQPLLAHVVTRFAPQVDALIINANGDQARFAGWNYRIVPDEGPSEGPLSGLLAALRHAHAKGYSLLATVPCDAPLLPLDLVARLCAALKEDDLAAIAQTPAGPEPLFALWRASAIPALEQALRHGVRAVHRLLSAMPHARAPFAATAQSPDPFLNLNTPQMLAKAQAALQPGGASLYTASNPSERIDQGS